MSTYRYEAVNEGGKTVAGLIEAESMDHANDLLGARGLTPLSMRDKSSNALNIWVAECTLWRRSAKAPCKAGSWLRVAIDSTRKPIACTG